MNAHYDAIIIGAGPAGATAAILLARAGWSVALLEKQEFPRRKVCGECIAATNLPLLDELGIGEAFDALAGAPLQQVAVMTGAHCIQAALPPLETGRHRWGRALGREHLDTLLLERARSAGAEVLQPWEVRAVQCDTEAPDTYLCEVAMVARSEEEIRGGAACLTAPVLIAAHGSWQRTPALGNGSRSRGGARAGDLFAFKANFRGTGLVDGLLPVLAFPGGYGGMVTGEQGIATLACCIRRDRLASVRRAVPGMPAGEAVEAWLKAGTAGVRLTLADARREGKWLSVGPIRPGIRMPRAADGGPFLVGNAAGEAHPIIGEGISMALQSAWLLCERLLADSGRVPCAAQRKRIRLDYAEQWRRSFAFRIRLAAVFAHAAMRPALAPALLPLLRHSPSLLTHAARLSGKVRSAVPRFSHARAALREG